MGGLRAVAFACVAFAWACDAEPWAWRAVLLPAHELSMLSYRLSCAIASASRAFVSDGSIKVTKGNSYKMLLATTFGSRF